MRVDAANREHKDVRVFLNDQDVSGVCCEADDVEGWARCLITDEQAMRQAIAENPDHDGFLWEVRYGKVTIVRAGALP